MTGSRLWLLNFEAEAELAGAPGPTPRDIVAPSWMGGRDRVLGESPTDPHAVGVAWCPTPGALARLTDEGVQHLPPTPGLAVLKAANARETFADLHPLGSLGAVVAETSVEVERAVARAAPARHSGRKPAWLLRRSLSAAGQGRLIVEVWSDDVATWVNRALRLGPLHVMPLVDIDGEFSGHAFLHRSGEVELGHHVDQVVRGAAWSSATRREQAVPELRRALDAVIKRLQGMGYFGPLGVDGFAWLDGAGAKHVAAGTDVNARYTMSMGAAFDTVP